MLDQQVVLVLVTTVELSLTQVTLQVEVALALLAVTEHVTLVQEQLAARRASILLSAICS